MRLDRKCLWAQALDSVQHDLRNTLYCLWELVKTYGQDIKDAASLRAYRKNFK